MKLFLIFEGLALILTFSPTGQKYYRAKNLGELPAYFLANGIFLTLCAAIWALIGHLINSNH